MLLASWIASFGVRKVVRVTTGPKISSLARIEAGSTPVASVGGKKHPAGAAPWCRTAPSATPFATRSRMRVSWTGCTIAPTSVDLSSGSPTRRCFMRALRRAVKRSATPSATRIREPAQQTWPWLNQIASTTPSTAASRSASGKTMNGDLPPSSSVSFLPEPAVWRRISLPTSVEPVKAILSTSGWPTIAAPVSPSPVTMLTTPFGRPISSQILAKASAVSGVYSAGFRTTVLPAASAGAIFHASMRSGKFQGITCPQTPTGRASGNSVSTSSAQPA